MQEAMKETYFPTLKKTIVDLASCNSSFAQMGRYSAKYSLHLGSSESYSSLYNSVAEEPSGLMCPGPVLKALRPVYLMKGRSPNGSYWQRFFQSDRQDLYPQKAWEKLAPFEVSLVPLLGVFPPTKLQVNIRAVPRVILYPFGWSVWISLLITQDHSLPDLDAVMRHLVWEQCYGLSSHLDRLLTRSDIFQDLSKVVSDEVFGSQEYETPRELLSVTTVLEKSGGAPTIDALTREQESALRRIVSPTRSLGQKSLEELTRPLQRGGEGAGNFDYALQAGQGIFIWADHKLRPPSLNAKQLRTYHDNTFLSLLHAWHLSVFLEHASRSGGRRHKRADPVADMVKSAVEQIDGQLKTRLLYRNVCLIEYLKTPEVQEAVEQARKAFRI